MMHLTPEQAQSFTIAGGTTGRLYPAHPAGEQSIAYVEMDGVYPEKGWSINDRCTETMYMLEGSFDIEVDGTWYTLNPGDVLMILPGKKYRCKGRGKSLDIITPAWDKSQNHIVE